MKSITCLVVGMFLLAFSCMAGEAFFVDGPITVAAGVTNVVKDDIMVCDAGGSGFRELDEFIVKNVSGTGTGTVTLLSVDIGVETQIMNAGSHIPGYSTISYPRRTDTSASTAMYFVTNAPVAYINAGGSYTDTNGTVIAMATTTNYYMKSVLVKVTDAATLSNYAKYNVRRLKINIAQPASATDNVYQFSIKAK